MKHNPNSKKLTIIRLSGDYKSLLENAIRIVEDEECIEVNGQILKYTNTWEFEFDNPDELFMFKLGTRYGVSLQQYLSVKAIA